jgi:hypothetical protein
MRIVAKIIVICAALLLSPVGIVCFGLARFVLYIIGIGR